MYYICSYTKIIKKGPLILEGKRQIMSTVFFSGFYETITHIRNMRRYLIMRKPTAREIRKQRWKELIIECNNSGMSKKQWCEENGILRLMGGSASLQSVEGFCLLHQR